MRKFFLVGLLSVGCASVGFSAQRPSAAPAPAPVMRSAPMPVAPHAPVVTHAPTVSHAPMVNRAPVVSHSPITGHAPSAHAPAQFHSAAHVAPSTPRPIAPPHHSVTTQSSRHRSHNGFRHNGNFFANDFFNECSGAPGLGFDYSHFFAVHPNCNHTVLGGVVLPYGGGGYYLPVPYYENGETQPQPQRETEARDNSESKQENESGEVAEGQESHFFNLPVSDYVFVKRDGTRIFAVAYSLSKDKLHYVTKDGLRRSLSLDTLDYEATEKSNEELGNTINLPRPLTSNVA